MPTRTLTVDGATWEVFPSGRITQSDHDEFALMFVRRVAGAPPEVRVTRYTPWSSQSRADSFAGMDSSELSRLFTLSQAGDTSPEAGYTP